MAFLFSILSGCSHQKRRAAGNGKCGPFGCIPYKWKNNANPRRQIHGKIHLFPFKSYSSIAFHPFYESIFEAMSKSVPFAAFKFREVAQLKERVSASQNVISK